MYLANLDINHDLYAGGIRKNQDHPYLYGVVLTFLRGKIAKVECRANDESRVQSKRACSICFAETKLSSAEPTIAKVECRAKAPVEPSAISSLYPRLNMAEA